jgi:hypothetical protein
MVGHCYQAYGLGVASDLPCPELPPGDRASDVRIRTGTVEGTLDDCAVRGAYYQLAPRRVLLSIRGVARYLITCGTEIVVDPEPGADGEVIRLFLLGGALGALLQQRGLLVLHGSCVAGADGAVVFLGPSGRGKSTLATALYRRGYVVLADDVTALTLASDGTPLVLPGPGYVRLLPDAGRLLGLRVPAPVATATRDDKSLVRLCARAGRDPIPLSRVCVLADAEGCEIEPGAVEGVDRFRTLLANLYRPELLHGALGGRSRYEHCVAVARSTPFDRVAWPRASGPFSEFIDRLDARLSPGRIPDRGAGATPGTPTAWGVA